MKRLLSCLGRPLLPLLLVAPLIAPTASAHDGKAGHPADLAKASQNPISSLISVPFENNSNFNVGPQDSYQNVMNVKPVVPVKLNEKWNLVNRAIIPTIYLDDRPGGQGSSALGFGDVTYQGFLTPAKPGDIIWGIGPSVQVPSGANRYSSKKLSVGPNLVVLTMPGPWVIGALVSNLWSVGGPSNARNVDFFTAQYFINYNFGKGWYVKTTPVITADWESSSDQRWTVPVGGGVGRIFHIGDQHLNFAVQGFYNVVKPDSAGNWDLQATLTFLFPD